LLVPLVNYGQEDRYPANQGLGVDGSIFDYLFQKSSMFALVNNTRSRKLLWSYSLSSCGILKPQFVTGCKHFHTQQSLLPKSTQGLQDVSDYSTAHSKVFTPPNSELRSWKEKWVSKLLLISGQRWWIFYLSILYKSIHHNKRGVG
jgi:hypothetical protein